MRLVSLHDRDAIETVLRRNTELQLYTLGDLDTFFWPSTVWYGLEDRGELRSVVLLYVATATPTLLALPSAAGDGTAELLRLALPLLPARLYAHIDPSFVELLAPLYCTASYGLHLKLALRDTRRVDSVATAAVFALRPADRTEIEALYEAAYPGNWFDPRMLETGQYYGVRRDGKLVGIAGIHVYSPTYRVAVIGNVVTHPDHRGQGIARAVTARLCRELRAKVDHIGLNVKADNAAALACYRSLGFETVAQYEECALELNNIRIHRRP